MDPSVATDFLVSTVASIFAPVVLVLCTREAQAICSKNDLTFAGMLRPFGIITRKVNTRTVKEAEYVSLKNFCVRFLAPEEFLVCDAQRVNAVLDEVVRDYRGRGHEDYEGLARRALEDDGGNGLNVNRRFTPWFEDYRDALCGALSFSEHETFGWPVCIMAVASASETNVVGQLSALASFRDHPVGSQSPFGVQHGLGTRAGSGAWNLSPAAASTLKEVLSDPDMPVFNVLLHEKHRPGADLQEAQRVLLSVQQRLGSTNLCKLLSVNSRNADSSLEVAPLSDLWSSHRPIFFDYAVRLQTGYPSPPVDASRAGRYLASEDVKSLSLFVEDFIVNTLLQFMESKIKTLNNVVAATRKGFKNQMKMWWRGRSKDSLTGGSDELLSKYRNTSIESQIRRLADLTFMCQDFDTALSNYRTVANDFKNDRALKHLAGAQEMMALCSCVLEGGRRESFSPLDDAITHYMKVDELFYAIRACLFLAEIYRLRGEYLRSYEVYFRAKNLDVSSFLRMGLFSEQMALCSVQLKPRMVRKFGFDLIMSGYRYSQCGQHQHAIRCYREGMRVYDRHRWMEILSHVFFTLGRLHGHLQQPSLAIAAYQRVLHDPSQPPEMHQSAFDEFLVAVGMYMASNERYTSNSLSVPGSAAPSTASNMFAMLQFDEATAGATPSSNPNAIGSTATAPVAPVPATPAFLALVNQAHTGTPPINPAQSVPGGSSQPTIAPPLSTSTEEDTIVDGQAESAAFAGPQLLFLPDLHIPSVSATQVRVLFNKYSAPSRVDEPLHEQWESLERDLLQTQLKHRLAFLFTGRRTQTVVVQEPILVEVVISNPLKIPLTVDDLRLVVSFTPAPGSNPDAAASANASGTTVATAVNSGTASAPFVVEPRKIVLQKSERVTVPLTVTPLREGTLEVRGAEWTLSGAVRCAVEFRVRGRRLNNNKQQRIGVVYDRDERLHFHVIGAAPLLETSVDDLPNPATFTAGQMHPATLVLRNSGQRPMRNVRVNLSHPQFFRIGRPEQLNVTMSVNGDGEQNSAVSLVEHARPAEAYLLADSENQYQPNPHPHHQVHNGVGDSVSADATRNGPDAQTPSVPSNSTRNLMAVGAEAPVSLCPTDHVFHRWLPSLHSVTSSCLQDPRSSLHSATSACHHHHHHHSHSHSHSHSSHHHTHHHGSAHHSIAQGPVSPSSSRSRSRSQLRSIVSLPGPPAGPTSTPSPPTVTALPSDASSPPPSSSAGLSVVIPNGSSSAGPSPSRSIDSSPSSPPQSQLKAPHPSTTTAIRQSSCLHGSERFEFAMISLPVAELGPGETIRLPLWVHAGSSSRGQYVCRFLFYYESDEPNNKELPFRLRQHTVEFAVQSGLDVSVRLTHSVRKAEEFSLHCRVMNQSKGVIRLDSVTTVSPFWGVSHMPICDESGSDVVDDCGEMVNNDVGNSFALNRDDSRSLTSASHGDGALEDPNAAIRAINAQITRPARCHPEEELFRWLPSSVIGPSESASMFFRIVAVTNEQHDALSAALVASGGSSVDSPSSSPNLSGAGALVRRNSTTLSPRSNHPSSSSSSSSSSALSTSSASSSSLGTSSNSAGPTIQFAHPQCPPLLYPVHLSSICFPTVNNATSLIASARQYQPASVVVDVSAHPFSDFVLIDSLAVYCDLHAILVSSSRRRSQSLGRGGGGGGGGGGGSSSGGGNRRAGFMAVQYVDSSVRKGEAARAREESAARDAAAGGRHGAGGGGGRSHSQTGKSGGGGGKQHHHPSHAPHGHGTTAHHSAQQSAQNRNRLQSRGFGGGFVESVGPLGGPGAAAYGRDRSFGWWGDRDKTEHLIRECLSSRRFCSFLLTWRDDVTGTVGFNTINQNFLIPGELLQFLTLLRSSPKLRRREDVAHEFRCSTSTKDCPVAMSVQFPACVMHDFYNLPLCEVPVEITIENLSDYPLTLLFEAMDLTDKSPIDHVTSEGSGTFWKGPVKCNVPMLSPHDSYTVKLHACLARSGVVDINAFQFTMYFDKRAGFPFHESRLAQLCAAVTSVQVFSTAEYWLTVRQTVK